MHECPFCGEKCDCDMDDTGGLPVPSDCPHVCADPGDDDDYPWEDDDYDAYDPMGPDCPQCGQPMTFIIERREWICVECEKARSGL